MTSFNKLLWFCFYRKVTELDELLHSAHVIASEMIHFTQQIGYYINFEVLLKKLSFMLFYNFSLEVWDG